MIVLCVVVVMCFLAPVVPAVGKTRQTIDVDGEIAQGSDLAIPTEPAGLPGSAGVHGSADVRRSAEMPERARVTEPDRSDSDRNELRELAGRAVAGDRSALQALFRELFPLVHKHLSFVLGFGALVDDAVQESMLRIHRALPGFRGEAAVATWALAIASRTAIKHAQRERRHRADDIDRTVDRAIGESLYGADAASSGAELVLLVKALGQLTPKKRVAFVLFAILDCSATEAGEVLGTSPNTAASRYRHARQELLDHLAQHGTGGLR
jgi:RNA polymerase sigma-70 factor (ECF subfamily)